MSKATDTVSRGLSSLSNPVGLTVLATTSAVSLLLALRFTIYSTTRKPQQRTIPSPRETLIPHITPTQAKALPYPSDLFPGARDVETPYGTMRVYEWGPEDGRKVLFIHGDTTPAPMFAPIAEALVRRGCRVMLFGTSAKNRRPLARGYLRKNLDCCIGCGHAEC